MEETYEQHYLFSLVPHGQASPIFTFKFNYASVHNYTQKSDVYYCERKLKSKQQQRTGDEETA